MAIRALPRKLHQTGAHEIGVKLAKELWGDRFEVIIATSGSATPSQPSFIAQYISFKDGLRYYDCNATYDLMRADLGPALQGNTAVPS